MLRCSKQKGFLNAPAIGILMFLIVDVLGHAWESAADVAVSAFLGGPLRETQCLIFLPCSEDLDSDQVRHAQKLLNALDIMRVALFERGRRQPNE